MEKPKKIDLLLIEDSLDDSELTLYAILNVDDRLHYQHFTTGEESLDFVFNNKTNWWHPVKDNLKLIILDLELPKANEVDIATTHNESEQTSEIPLLVLSSS